MKDRRAFAGEAKEELSARVLFALPSLRHIKLAEIQRNNTTLHYTTALHRKRVGTWNGRTLHLNQITLVRSRSRLVKKEFRRK